MERTGGGRTKRHIRTDEFHVVRVLRQLGVFVWAFMVALWCLIGWGLYYLAGM